MENSQQKIRLSKRTALYIAVPFLLVFSMGSWSLFTSYRKTPETVATEPTETQQAPPEPVVAEPEQPQVAHTPLPEEVRGIYWTVATAGSERGDELLQYMKTHGLNTAVIDLKLDNGALGFEPTNPELKPYAAEKPSAKDFPERLEQLYESGIYRIARIAVMRDSVFTRLHPDQAMQTANGTVWHDTTGAGWVDPASPLAAEYALALAREAYDMGFDEIQFDYIRFASDGALGAIRHSQYDETQTKHEVMKAFFDKMATLHEASIPLSFDVFGMTFWSTSDFGIGQRLEDVFSDADFVSPMVYPSHYPNGFEGFSNPALYPYEIVKRSLDKGAELLSTDHFIQEEDSRAKFRPWLQDFDIGAVYTAARIKAEIQAARDAGAAGWILWNARNVYEPVQYDAPSSHN